MRCSDCGKPVKPVVGLDLDGTIADYYNDFRLFAERYYNRRLRPNYDGSCSFGEWLGLTQEQYRQAKLAYRQGGGKRMMPALQGGVALADDIYTQAELWITTTRPYNRFDSTDPDTREWLRRHGIAHHHLIYDDDKFKRLVDIVGHDRIACVVDDLPENVNRAAQLNLHAVIVSRQHNVNARLARAVLRVPNLYEARAAVSHLIKEWGS